MLTCAGCHQPIRGRHVVALGAAWHGACFRCAKCGLPFAGQKFYEHGGKPYCRADYTRFVGPVCAVDGAAIGTDRYRVKDGLRYCEAHYWEKFGVRCAIGKEYLKAEYLVNVWGDAYCAGHSAGLPVCPSCWRPICEPLTGGGARYADGRTVCRRCAGASIHELAAAQRLLDEARAGLRRAGLDTGTGPLPLELTDQATLARHAKPHAPAPLGLFFATTITHGDGRVERCVDAIRILYGLTREHFQAVAAHELMHAHMFLFAFPDLPDEIDEGLCELIEYAWLRHRRTPEAAVRLKMQAANGNPVYGGGLRAGLAALEKMTLPELLAYVREHGRWP